MTTSRTTTKDAAARIAAASFRAQARRGFTPGEWQLLRATLEVMTTRDLKRLAALMRCQATVIEVVLERRAEPRLAAKRRRRVR